MTKLPPTIFLDLDDTIISFSANTDACWEYACRQFAPQLDGFTSAQLRAAIGEVSGWFWADAERHRQGRQNLPLARREIVRLAFEKLSVSAPTLAQQLADTYTVERDKTICLFPGAVETLHYFRAQGVRLALLTNGNAAEQRRKIDRFNLASFFECIVIEGEFGVGKPDARVYHFALNQLAVDPSAVWMVGDNLEWDVAGAQRVGILGIWVDGEGRGLPPASPVQPDRIIHTLAELMA